MAADPTMTNGAAVGTPERSGAAGSEARPASGAASDGVSAPLESRVRDVDRAFTRALQSGLAAHTITVGQWRFLRALPDGDGIGQRELCRRVGVAEATGVTMLNGLEARGLVRRNRGTTDRRRSNVQLTAKGQDLRPVLEVVAHQVGRRALIGVDPDQLRHTLDALRRIAANLSDPSSVDAMRGDGDDDG